MPPSVPVRRSPPLLVLEGVDGSGKSSQARLLAGRMRAAGARVAEPTRDPARALRRVYKSLISAAEGFPSAETSLLLGLSDYSYALEQHRDAAADVLLFERYCYSAIADGIALGLDPEQAAGLTAFFPDPDLTLFIDVDPELALARKGSCTLAEAGGPEFSAGHRDLESSFVAYQAAVSAAYRFLGSSGRVPRLAVIDGNQERDAVTAQILAAVPEFLKGARAA